MFQLRRPHFISVLVVLIAISPLCAADDDLIPARLPKDQRENLQRFLTEHSKPERFVPKDAKIVDAPPSSVATPATDKPIKQYTVQIVAHRPTPDQPEVKRVDVIYYRPNPDKGKPGITVKHTVDLTTGKQIGDTEVLVKAHTPVLREELAEAVALAREKSPAVQALYKDREAKAVRWEYLQLLVNRKNGETEPGDRVVRFVFMVGEGKEEARPVAVVVNLTKGVVSSGER